MRIPSVAALAIGANSPLIGDHRGGKCIARKDTDQEGG